ncbi:MAG: ATP-binding protein [Vicinamibacterales bacterium]
MRPPPLRTSLTVVYTGLLAVLLTGVALGYHQLLVRQIERDATESLEETARALHGYIRVGDRGPAVAYDDRDTDAAAFVDEATRYFQIFDRPTGRLLTQSRGFALAGVDYTPAEVAQFAERPGIHDVQADRGRLRISTTLVTPAPDVSYVLQVGLPLEQADRSVEGLERLLVWGVALGLVASALLGRWMAGRALAPLSRLAHATRTIEVRTLDRRLPVRGAHDELDEVADAFNHALNRLERSVTDMRQFSAALAHELRTPLAILRGEAELALSATATHEDIRRALQTQLEEFDRLHGLITQVLTLARAESGQIRLAHDAIDLGALAREVVEQLEPVAAARGITLTCDAQDAVVTGDPGWLRRLLLILLDNAIKFTDRDGGIRVTVDGTGDQAVLAVSDSGVGMNSDVLAHAFEPFYRGDAARTTHGAGLGLALARWIAEQHGARLDAVSGEAHGTTFTLRLPLASAFQPTS